MPARTPHQPTRTPRPRATGEPPEPLGEHELPAALAAAVGVCAIVAVAVLVTAATVHDLSRHGGSFPGAVFIAALLTALAAGMYRHRYWALLSFQALLAFQILVTSLALVVASSVIAALGCLASVVLGGLLSWKLIGVMARLQAGHR